MSAALCSIHLQAMASLSFHAWSLGPPGATTAIGGNGYSHQTAVATIYKTTHNTKLRSHIIFPNRQDALSNTLDTMRGINTTYSLTPTSTPNISLHPLQHKPS
eukprot:TRINITY_DN86137_c0_g1_i1.p2 TRINITY_DN86137_c0_g1~~TRINITY_DN86137_c0_g1_i1.p2  ORF type:complete len:103 (-),score=1.94 TRINITY_DN86137_c0_g1_i1:436-744(-)